MLGTLNRLSSIHDFGFDWTTFYSPGCWSPAQVRQEVHFALITTKLRRMRFGELLGPRGSSRIGSEYFENVFQLLPSWDIFLRRLDRLDRSVSLGHSLYAFRYFRSMHFLVCASRRPVSMFLFLFSKSSILHFAWLLSRQCVRIPTWIIMHLYDGPVPALFPNVIQHKMFATPRYIFVSCHRHGAGKWLRSCRRIWHRHVSFSMSCCNKESG